MTIAEQRNHASELLVKVDDQFFRAIYAMLETYVLEKGENPIIGYDSDGAAVRADMALEQFKQDLSKPEEFISLEDFKAERANRSAA